MLSWHMEKWIAVLLLVGFVSCLVVDDRLHLAGDLIVSRCSPWGQCGRDVGCSDVSFVDWGVLSSRWRSGTRPVEVIVGHTLHEG